MDKSAVSALYLLKNSPQVIKSNARSYTAQLIRSRGYSYVYRVGDYIVRIRAVGQMINKSNKDILLSCTCNFWKWNGPDFNAANQGYSERAFSNLSEPVVRDPHNQFLVCKHAYAALDQFRHDFPTN